MKSPERTIYFGGQWLVLHAHGVIYWPSQKTLVASDLHFEKSTFLARQGSFIPPYDTQDTLDRLEHFIGHYQPERLILLGDSFHDRHAWDRLEEPLRTRILALNTRVRECIWIEGNHDVALQGHPLGTLTVTTHIEGLHFAHDTTVPVLPVIIGHYHPKAYVYLGKRSASGKCFIHSDTLLVMPSFGSYTGGLDIRHEAMQALFPDQAPKVHLLYQESVYPLPSGSSQPARRRQDS